MLTHASARTPLKAKLFRGFSDMSRLSILEALRQGPLTVGAIVERRQRSWRKRGMCDGQFFAFASRPRH